MSTYTKALAAHRMHATRHPFRVAGAMRTFAALERGAAAELLLTPGFIELQPAAASHAVELAARHGTRTTLLSGVAALELDLVGDGVGARLRRPLPHAGTLSLSA